MRTGSQDRAFFTGDAGAEYAWFASAASLPLLSMNADRAARRIVAGVLAGRPLVTLTPLTWLAFRFRGLLPGTTTRLMGVINQLLPRSTGDDDEVDGATAGGRRPSVLVRALTTLGRAAAERNNER